MKIHDTSVRISTGLSIAFALFSTREASAACPILGWSTVDCSTTAPVCWGGYGSGPVTCDLDVAGMAASSSDTTLTMETYVIPPPFGGTYVVVYGRDSTDTRYCCTKDDLTGVPAAALTTVQVTGVDDIDTFDDIDLSGVSPSSSVLVETRAGDDWVVGTQSANVIWGGYGDDHLTGGPAADTIYGQYDNDWIDGGAGDDTLYAAGTSNGYQGGVHNWIYGNNGYDTIYGSDNSGGADYLDGGNHDDELVGRAGADILCGKGGSDDLYGWGGDDILVGGAETTDYSLGGNDTDDCDWNNDILIPLCENGHLDSSWTCPAFPAWP